VTPAEKRIARREESVCGRTRSTDREDPEHRRRGDGLFIVARIVEANLYGWQLARIGLIKEIFSNKPDLKNK
jgi:hypothetical protein